ncbi:ADP-ribosylglycohydrolase family protein [Umezawaea sp. Da 62-37]|uniref:ADP-ribosylglycohydrolase family protein n=1 Tax=Umezawaea sp. Da 62-37 TaxID=3075927 RepID=UPI0028F6C9E0|nr:ADP-ribosylglycohydrolase family protein [Umezawaea sp. Da 62-37]WNV85740.1 ADP-ribosylglycohydrolase family protein [Umezawaea sp. Da 62-37]
MDRIAGSFYGLAFGDALGKPTEFLTVEDIDRVFGPDGPNDLSGDPALVTDDTQMALAVAWALHDADHLTPDVLEPLLRRRFVAWAHSPENNRAPGMTCLRACGGLAEGLPWVEATVTGSKGCGANMRVTPVGLVPDLDLDVLAGVSQLQAAMTHGHPTALAASELTAYATRLLVDGINLADVPALLLARCHERRTVYLEDWLGALWKTPGATTSTDFIARGWDECVGVLERLVAALAEPDHGTDACLATGAGWIAEEALATGLYCAVRHADNPVDTLVRGARTSGDSDSVAALAGAFTGASHGLSAWPSEWVERIEYADQLAALTSGAPRPGTVTAEP